MHPAESVGRGIFLKRRRRALPGSGAARWRVFFEPARNSLSVDRIDLGPRDELTVIQKKNGEARTPPRDFHGWAALSVAEAGSNGREVEASPQLENRFHADILFPAAPDEGEQRRDYLREHAAQMAAASRFEPPGTK